MAPRQTSPVTSNASLYYLVPEGEPDTSRHCEDDQAGNWAPRRAGSVTCPDPTVTFPTSDSQCGDKNPNFDRL